MIYHWCPEEDWQAATAEYAPPGLAVEGFIHCSFFHQVEKTATNLDNGRDDLVLLCVDDSELAVVVEDCYETGQGFPHVYGPIPVETVKRVLPFPPNSDGSFTLPPDTPR